MSSLQSLPKALDLDNYPLTLNSKSVETYMHLPNVRKIRYTLSASI